jgi:acetylornithine deacetylase/succinyl-diaminopimelate desuccinylase-like protein
MSTTDAVLSWLRTNEKSSVERLIDWLRIPSVSTDPAYKEKVRDAAQWCARQLTDAGLQVEVRETGDVGRDGRGSGHPVVWATSPGAPGYKGPHVLFYGHYDVQPADPVELWESGPFDPVVRPAQPGGPGERIIARGAVDDKGQVMMFLEALRAWKETSGQVAGGVKFSVLIEGEEESSSANLGRFVKDHLDEIKACDVCLISDTGMLGRERPAITYGVRGIAYTEVTLHAANQDLHSGLWGGRAPNPINELAKIIASMWDRNGRVTIPGFYDKVVPLTEGERVAWRKLPFNGVEALKKIGLPPEADQWGGQEHGYNTLEREWGRPCADVNGMFGGYTGEGAKTVIAAKATAKISFRLVANQDPAEIVKAFFSWLQQKTPPGCRIETKELGMGFPATVPTDSKHLAAAARAVERATGRAPDMIKSGGSIPVAGMLKGLAGLDTIFMGFGLDDDRVHSPNEKFELDCFRMGARSHALFIDELTR